MIEIPDELAGDLYEARANYNASLVAGDDALPVAAYWNDYQRVKDKLCLYVLEVVWARKFKQQVEGCKR